MANSRVRFTVAGVDSPDDAEEIEDALRDKEGVQLVDLNQETGESEVRHGEALISDEEILSTVEDLGYEVESNDEEP
jgi:copper chaperone CopZ